MPRAGPLAARIVHPHPFHYGYGPGTPFARIVEAGAQILMLGAPLDTITLLHHAEHLADIPGKRVVRYRRLMPSPEGPRWVDFEEFDTAAPVHAGLPENCFELIARDFLAAHPSQPEPNHSGPKTRQVAQAAAYLFPAPELVRFAVRWMEDVSPTLPRTALGGSP